MFEIINRLEALVEEAEKMKNSYFFIPPQNASSRRYYEKVHSIAPIEWTESGHKYSAEFKVVCSCSNVYAHGMYYRDDKKTTLTAIKNSLLRMKKLEGYIYG